MSNVPRLYWSPSEEYIRKTNYDFFRRYINKSCGTQFGATDYWALHAWVVETPENINAFWSALWDFSGLIGERGSGPVRHADVSTATGC